MRFRSAERIGAQVEEIPYLEASRLRLQLPDALRSADATPKFLATVARVAAMLRPHYKDVAEMQKPGEARKQLVDVERAARRMQVALGPLAGGSQLYDLAAGKFSFAHTFARAKRTRGPDEIDMEFFIDPPGSLWVLLERVDADLTLLRVVCDYVAAQVKPDRNAPKGPERGLVHMVATVHRDCYGRWPPARSWFEPFMIYVGKEVGLDLGHTVVGSVVAELKASTRK